MPCVEFKATLILTVSPPLNPNPTSETFCALPLVAPSTGFEYGVIILAQLFFVASILCTVILYVPFVAPLQLALKNGLSLSIQLFVPPLAVTELNGVGLTGGGAKLSTVQYPLAAALFPLQLCILPTYLYINSTTTINPKVATSKN